jgi:tocopherol cyclase
MIKRIFTPSLYHGRGKKGIFFEGWYYKIISADRKQRWAVIPGIFHHPDREKRHSFIQVLDGQNSKVIYHRFPIESFRASTSSFNIKIGQNAFHSQGFSLDLSEKNQTIRGTLNFGELYPWPISLFSPGVMGPYRYAPLMQTYHGILSLDHKIWGSLKINHSEVDFSGGRGYIEKDWGKTFPRGYIWMQSNHFPEEGISLSASVATIPWLTGWFRGFVVGLLIRGTFYRFTTYLGSRIDLLSVTDRFVTWRLLGSRRSDPAAEYPFYQLDIRAERGQAGLLSSPELDGMTPRILESLTGIIEMTLIGMNSENQQQEIIYKGSGYCAGLEVAGSIAEIADLDQTEVI